MMDLDNRLTEDEALDQAYDIFLNWPSTTSTLLTLFYLTCSLKSAVRQNYLIPPKTGKITLIST